MSHVCFAGKEWKNTNDRPWVDRGLFYQVRVEARPYYNNITSTHISGVEDVSKACSLLFHCNCEKAIRPKGNYNSGKAGLR